MHSNTDNKKFTSYNDGNEIAMNSLSHLKHQDNFWTSIKGSDFIFDSVQFMYYRRHKVFLNTSTIALNILYIKEKVIFPVYISKHNSTHEKEIIFLMLPNEQKEGWHYPAVKKISALLHSKKI